MAMMNPSPRGITLLIAVILSTVVLSVALALLDITYKQVLLASSAKQSQFAFYNADSVMECALYWDQQKAAFSYTESSYISNGITCSNQTIVPSLTPNSSSQVGSTRTTTFFLPCAGGDASRIQGQVTVVKASSGATSIFATGYSTCDASDPRRIERGLKVSY